MTEETRPGFLANYKIARPGPARLGPARIRPGPVDTSTAKHKLGINTKLQSKLYRTSRPFESANAGKLVWNGVRG